MKQIIFLFFLLCSLLSASAQQADTLTNEKIIKLFKAGFSKEVLKSKIQTSAAKFDVSIDGMIKLKQAGVPEEVINVMIAKPQETANSTNSVQNIYDGKKISLRSGIYYKNAQAEYMEIEPSVLTSTKTNSGAQILISPFINAKIKASLSGKKSSFEIGEVSPKLYFIFDTTQGGSLNTDNNLFFANARSPKEFLLVKLDISKNSREITVGKGNAINSNAGIDDKHVVGFTSKKLSNGQYEVIPETSLEEGEYCIMFAQGIKSGQTGKVFDFSIRKAKGV